MKLRSEGVCHVDSDVFQAQGRANIVSITFMANDR